MLSSLNRKSHEMTLVPDMLYICGVRSTEYEVLRCVILIMQEFTRSRINT